MTLRTICLSHSPFHGLVSPGERNQIEISGKMAGLASEVRDYDPDLIIMFAPDHFNGFFYDVMPQFCIGIQAESIGDYETPRGPLNVPADLARKCAEAVIADGVDLAVSYRMRVDHAFAQPLCHLAGALDRVPVLPFFINSAAPPRASCARARALGQAVGRFALAQAGKVLLIGSGGLSHDTGAPVIEGAAPEIADFLIEGRNPSAEDRRARQERTMQAGRDFAAGQSALHPLNDAWDQDFLNIIASGDLAAFDHFDDKGITEQAGAAAHEVRAWIAAFAAQATAGPYAADILYRAAIPEWIVSMAIASAVTREAVA